MRIKFNGAHFLFISKKIDGLEENKCVIKTNGHCFMCVKRVPEPAQDSPLEHISNYLQINVTSVFIQSSGVKIPSFVLNKLEGATLNVVLCGDCSRSNEKLEKILSEESVSKEILKWISYFQNKISKAEVAEKEGCNELVKGFWKEILEKSKSKMKAIQPNIILKCLTQQEVADLSSSVRVEMGTGLNYSASVLSPLPSSVHPKSVVTNSSSQVNINEKTKAESDTCPIFGTNIKTERRNLRMPLSEKVVINDETTAAYKYYLRTRALITKTEEEQKPNIKEDGSEATTTKRYIFRRRPLKMPTVGEHKSQEKEPNAPTKRRVRRRMGQKETSSISGFSKPGTTKTNIMRIRGRPFQGKIALKRSARFRFLCADCCAKFATRSLLEQHRRTHTGEKPFNCRRCRKAFAQTTTLNNHVRIHTGERPFVCTYKKCNKRFSQAGTLSNHEKAHTKPYKCSTCGKKAYAQRASRDSHEKRCRG